MTTSYIAWDDGRLRPLLYGIMANLSPWSFQLRQIHTATPARRAPMPTSACAS